VAMLVAVIYVHIKQSTSHLTIIRLKSHNHITLQQNGVKTYIW